MFRDDAAGLSGRSVAEIFGQSTGQGVMTGFMNFRKAFDHVWHAGLMYKLAALGIELQSLAWLNNYLSGRMT